MKYLYLSLPTIVVVALLGFVLGSRIPAHSEREQKFSLKVSASELKAVLENPIEFSKSWTRWSSVKLWHYRQGVEKGAWIVSDSGGHFCLTLLESADASSMHYRTCDETLPIGGEWFIRLESIGNVAKIAITQKEFVKPPLKRIWMSWTGGRGALLEEFHQLLCKKYTCTTL